MTSLFGGDYHLLLLASALIFSLNIQDNGVVLRVGHFKGNLNFRNATRCWGDTTQFKLAQQVAVLCHESLTLEHLNKDSVLVVGMCGEGL
mmetsp:Transcript_1169/g.1779  ORF Transcript_1169/g.1779 Transcript_1169/m.1779 type:complete len:90 (-) Transcript_1169:47-316(-)